MMSFATIWLNAVTGTANTRINLLIELITIIFYCCYVYLVLQQWNLSILYGWMSEWVYWGSIFQSLLLVYPQRKVERESDLSHIYQPKHRTASTAAGTRQSGWSTSNTSSFTITGPVKPDPRS